VVILKVSAIPQDDTVWEIHAKDLAVIKLAFVSSVRLYKDFVTWHRIHFFKLCSISWSLFSISLSTLNLWGSSFGAVLIWNFGSKLVWNTECRLSMLWYFMYTTQSSFLILWTRETGLQLYFSVYCVKMQSDPFRERRYIRRASYRVHVCKNICCLFCETLCASEILMINVNGFYVINTRIHFISYSLERNIHYLNVNEIMFPQFIISVFLFFGIFTMCCK
jgi:hypothetical protein